MATKNANATKKNGGGYFKSVRSELRKVSWPNRKELTSYTTVVLVMCGIAAVSIGFIDAVFQYMTRLFL